MQNDAQPPVNDNEYWFERVIKKYPRQTSSFFGLGLGAVFHPIYCAKVLMQLGHEPLPLQRSKAYICFGRDAYFLPNVFKCISHIKKRDGLATLYTCVGGNLFSNFLALGTSLKMLDYLNETCPDEIVPVERLRIETTGQAYSRLIRKLSKETMSKAVGIIVARPFQVVVIRRIAQIVGGETIYVSTIGSLQKIFDEEGVPGLFSGLMPQLVGEMMVLWVSSSLLFAFDRYCSQVHNAPQDPVNQEEDVEPGPASSVKKFVHFAIPYIVNSYFYGFQLVATMLAVNGTALKAGRPPFVPIFFHWQDCWAYLANQKQIKRGSKLFFRQYVGPVDFKDGEIFARAPKYGKKSLLHDLQRILNETPTKFIETLGRMVSSIF